MKAIDSPPRTKRWRTFSIWVATGAGVWMVAVALLAVDVLTLGRDARALRNEMLATLDTPTGTKIQLGAGPALLSAVRLGAWATDRLPPEARVALAAVRSASVGVYEARRPLGSGERTKLFLAADRVMSRRGWLRIVGVNDANSTVMIYAPKAGRETDPPHVCLAVCEGRQVVVVDATAKPDALIALATRNVARLAAD